MLEAATSSDDVDEIVSDGDDVDIPINDVDVWIDPLDATQVRFNEEVVPVRDSLFESPIL